MSKIFIFDVDGTLTPSRQPMTKEFQEFFKEWVKKNKFYLVTGSDLPKLQEQMCYFDIEAQRIFTCCGNQMWKPDPHIVNVSAELVYDNKFEVPRKLKKLLGTILSNSSYPHRYGNHVEYRGSMINFSIVGRKCNQKQREEYYKWDKENGERKIIATAVKEKCPDLDAVIGGQISIDIYPKGCDKSQILTHIFKLQESSFTDFATSGFKLSNEYIFIGDGVKKGGNDYPLAKIMEDKSSCKSYHTEGWKQTQEILEKLSD